MDEARHTGVSSSAGGLVSGRKSEITNYSFDSVAMMDQDNDPKSNSVNGEQVSFKTKSLLYSKNGDHTKTASRESLSKPPPKETTNESIDSQSKNTRKRRTRSVDGIRKVGRHVSFLVRINFDA
jgi:hypothetical protein